MVYEERHGSGWRGIDIAGEMLMGSAHHVIYFASPEKWAAYPEWARHRRDEIMGRIKSGFRPPDYEYHEGGAAAPVPSAAPAATDVRRPVVPKSTANQRSSLLLVAFILLGIACGMGWLAKGGLDKGTTYFPSKRASLQRSVSRELEPVTFWFAVALYSSIGLGTGGVAIWLVREAVRRSP